MDRILNLTISNVRMPILDQLQLLEGIYYIGFITAPTHHTIYRAVTCVVDTIVVVKSEDIDCHMAVF